MSGVVVADFESVIKKCEIGISDINESIQALRTASLELRRSIKNSDLSFLTENLYYDINECSKVTKKMNAYRSVLRSVLKSYQYQEQRIASTVKRITP